MTIFDKIHSSSANGIITYKDVIANLNILDYDYFFRITDACLREDITEILLTLDEIIKLGFDPEIFVIGMAEHFRDLLIAKVPATLHILELSEELKIRYNNQALLAPTSFLLSGLNILNQCDIDLARAKNKRLQVELALTKLAYINKAIEVSIFDNSAAHEKKKLTV